VTASHQNTQRRRKVQAILRSVGYCLPALLIFALFSYLPFLRSIWLSMHVTNAIGDPVRFTGLTYYLRIFTQREYVDAILLTLKFAAMVVPLSIISGLALAVLANARLHRIQLFRTIFTSSIAISLASAGVIFSMLYSPVIGVTAGFERLLGLASPGLLSNASTALAAVAVMTVWSGLGFNFVLCLSGLQAIPEEIYESAAIDGATGWRLFRYMTLPLIAPTLMFLLIVGTISSAQAFTQFNVLMAGPGPESSTNVFVYSTFRMFWYENRYGFSSAMSIVLFVLLFALSVIQFRTLDSRVHYQ
jgi:sn-glycerol 3-phosphate transport system permease protein